MKKTRTSKKKQHDILSSEEIDALLSATGSGEIKVEEFPTIGWEDDLEDRIDNYNFREGQWIYIQWTRRSSYEDHVFEDDALYGFIRDVGTEINYHHFLNSKKEKKYLSADAAKYLTDMNSKDIGKVLAMFDPNKAKKLKKFGVNAGIEYEPSTRLLIQGVSLNPYETGFGKIAAVSRFPQLYDLQRKGTLLLDKNYIKAVHGDVYLDWIDIRNGLENNNRVEYLQIIQGRLGVKLHEIYRETFNQTQK